MADSLNRRPLPFILVALLLLGGASGMGMGGASGMLAYAAEPSADAAFSSGGADPTRPPVSLQAPEPVPGVEGGGASDAMAASGLQSVIFREGAKPVAIINGQRVSLGDRFGDSKLVSITESSVVLQGPNGREVMRLTPTVEIKPVVTLTPKIKARHKTSKKNKKIKKIKKVESFSESLPEQNPN